MSILRIIFKIINFIRSVFSEYESVRTIPEIGVRTLFSRNFRTILVEAFVWKSEYG